MDQALALKSKIQNHSAQVGVVGLGYVGLPLVKRISESGFKVLGFDVDSTKVAQLNQGKSYIKHISDRNIQYILNNGFKATEDFLLAKNCDVIIICVPTPLTKQREPDLSFIENTLLALGPSLRSGQLLSLESTTYPGTTDEVVQPLVETSGNKVGESIFLAYSPEREDPGNLSFSTQTIPKVVGGVSTQCLELGVLFYQQFIDNVVPVSSTRTAEMTKLLENIHRAVNIGLVNEMKIVCDKMNIDIHEVVKAAATKPFGFTAFYPGPGLGGHCIPIDPFYLTWKAREYGLNTRFIELSGEVNASMPQFVVSKLIDGLNEKSKSIRGSKILILGISYKKNVDDMRESPAVAIMELIRAKGADIFYSDPWVHKFPKMREHNFDLSSVLITKEAIVQYDAVILTTDHDDFDYGLILEHAQMIVDTRGKYSADNPKVIRA